MRKSILFLLLLAVILSLIVGCGGKDVSGKYVSSNGNGLTLELTPEGKAYWTWTAEESGLPDPIEIKEVYKVAGNTVKTFEEGKEKDATILEIRNEDLIETENDLRFVKQEKSSEGLNKGIEESNITQAQKRTCQANLRTIDGAMAAYNADTGKNPDSVETLVQAGYLKKVPTCPSGSLPYELRGDPLEAFCPNDPSHTL